VNQPKQKFSIISLGCARNLVDSEVMSGLLEENQYQMVQEPADADVVLINTCGFIDAAKAESIDTIVEISRLKKEGTLRKLVVAGCLSQRYPQELATELPEVDLFIGTGEIPRIVNILKEHERNQNRRHYVGIPEYLYDHVTPRLRSTPSYTAFLKVSEGCDHKCAFCIIPKLRGSHRSRAIESVIKEATMLAQTGVKEINLIAQDLTAYGRDRKDGTTLYGLLDELVHVPDLVWIRLLYAYPNFLDSQLLQLINNSEKICKYIDIPFQHVSAGILKSMRRGKSGSAVQATIEKLRESISGLILRSSLIVGFPGETEEDFQALLDFVERTKFERLGVFKYSIEEGTAAASLPDHVDEEEKERRWQEVMDLQASISQIKNEALIGSIQRVIIDGIDETGQLVGRTQGHAPEVDGLVYLQNPASLRSGDFADVKITEALEYDLIGELQHV
jgi:ribosomal protein S12 methylthiotransferase